MRHNEHGHSHAQNRYAVLPVAARLDADTHLTGKGVTLAFIDSGFYPHPDLTRPHDRILAFVDITDPRATLSDGRPNSWDWHGTQTAVAAAGNGHLADGDYRGLASDARVVLVKASDRGRIPEANIARAIRWVITNKDRFNIRVVSISLGGDEDVPYRENIVDREAEAAVAAGLVVVVAAGNSGDAEAHTPVPPANAPSVITVGGYDDKNRLGARELDLYWSSFGPTADGLVKPEIIAPAIRVAAPILPGTEAYERAEALSQIAAVPDYMLETVARLTDRSEYVLSGLTSDLWRKAGLPESFRHERPDVIRALAEARLRESKVVATHYQHVDGTSFAAPIVASVVAQMIEANPGLTPDAIKHILISTADRIGGAPLMRQGYGVVNARRAVDGARREQHAGASCFLCPPRVEAGKLVFTYHDDAARAVGVAGDFNAWDSAAAPFVNRGGGVWRAEIETPAPGLYQYKFVVDDARWVEDPANGFKAPDAYGGLNSVIHIA
ncbi:MAG TPA: S8 family serine peptidase [Blastocatellia bacterium]|nr:S8 family serine peptidase [Blastocatellia bacterium]